MDCDQQKADFEKIQNSYKILETNKYDIVYSNIFKKQKMFIQ